MERHFTTRSRGPEDLDSHVSATSGMYYLGGLVESLEEIEVRHDPKDRILLRNMRQGKSTRVVTNTNSYRITRPLMDNDVVLDVTLP